MFQCRTTWLYDPVIYLFTIRLISYKASCIRCLCFFRNLIIWCKYTFKSNDTSFLVIQRTNRCINDIFCSYFCFCFFCFFTIAKTVSSIGVISTFVFTKLMLLTLFLICSCYTYTFTYILQFFQHFLCFFFF